MVEMATWKNGEMAESILPISEFAISPFFNFAISIDNHSVSNPQHEQDEPVERPRDTRTSGATTSGIRVQVQSTYVPAQRPVNW